MRDMILFTQETLENWDKKNIEFPYISSIVLRNENVPLFEEDYGQLDVDWLYKISKLKGAKTEKSVIRYENGNNLSLDPIYRERDYAMALSLVNKVGRKRLNSTKGRYHYVKGEYTEARKYFLKSKLSVKVILYYLTSFSPSIAKIITNKFRVFG